MTIGVAFTARFDPEAPRRTLVPPLNEALTGLRSVGWTLALQEMVGRGSGGPTVYRAGAFHDINFFGLFEAPSWAAALAGIAELDAAGWGRLAATEWLLGPRDLPPTPAAEAPRHALGFLALWNWNDAWHAASATERRAYDAECDVAFAADTGLGADQAGRFATSLTSGWDHVSLWELPDPDMLAISMGCHERARDFMFTTSSHYIGRAIPFAALEGEA